MVKCKGYGCDKEATHIQQANPFASEIHGNETPTDLCENCWEESIGDI